MNIMKKKWWFFLIIVILVIYLIGYLVVKSFSTQLAVVRITGTISSSKEIADFVNMVTDNPRIRGMLLLVNSPGGGIVPSDEIYQSLLKFKRSDRPIVAYLGTTAASGGYYIACASNYIVSHPMSITGSIGVIMEYPVVKGLMDKLGVDFVVVKSGENKDIGSPFRGMTAKEREVLKEIVDQGYERFVDVVATSRNIPTDSILKIADGRVITGNDAYRFGLVDTTGTMELAQDILKKMVKATGHIQWVEKRKTPYFMRLLEPYEILEDDMGAKLDYRMVLP